MQFWHWPGLDALARCSGNQRKVRGWDGLTYLLRTILLTPYSTYFPTHPPIHNVQTPPSRIRMQRRVQIRCQKVICSPKYVQQQPNPTTIQRQMCKPNWNIQDISFASNSMIFAKCLRGARLSASDSSTIFLFDSENGQDYSKWMFMWRLGGLNLASTANTGGILVEGRKDRFDLSEKTSKQASKQARKWTIYHYWPPS